MSESTQIVTVDSVRTELRRAIFWVSFMSTGMEIEQRTEEQKNACVTAQNLATFGVNAGLFTPEEGNEWLDAIYGRKLLAEVATKYLEGEPEAEAEASK